MMLFQRLGSDRRSFVQTAHQSCQQGSPFVRNLPSSSDQTSTCGHLTIERLGMVRAAMRVLLPQEQRSNPITNPRNAQEYLENANELYDEYTVVDLVGVGTYVGPSDIANYFAVPMPQLSGIVNVAGDYGQMVASFLGPDSYVLHSARFEQWAHRALSGNFSDATPLISTIENYYEFYPCSTVTKSSVYVFPVQLLVGFVEAAGQPHAMSNYCTKIMHDCTGDNQQYLGWDDCMSYASDLPHLDPWCQQKYGPHSIKGNSFACKFLHHVMAGLDPSQHCFHSGKGLADVNGVRKCVVQDCAPSDAVGVSWALHDTSLVPSIWSKSTDADGIDFWMDVPANSSVVPEQTLLATNQRLAQKVAPEACSNADMDELVAATLTSLEACLPFLGIEYHSAKQPNLCQDAVNVYFGRLVSNGVFCRCHEHRGQEAIMSRSVVLTKLQIDPATLLNHFALSAQPNLVCLSAQTTVTHEACLPGQYLSRVGCVLWSYASLHDSVRSDWKADSVPIQPRVTQSIEVAETECHLISAFESSVRHQWRAFLGDDMSFYDDRRGGFEISVHFPEDPISIQLFPESPQRTHVLRHYEVVSELRNASQLRTPGLFLCNNCKFSAPPKFPSIGTTGASTYSNYHVHGRQLVMKLLPALSMNSPPPTALVTQLMDFHLQVRGVTRHDLKDISVIENVARGMLVYMLFGLDPSSDVDHGHLRSACDNLGAVAFLSHGSRTLNRINVGLPLSAYLTLRNLWLSILPTIIPASLMREYVSEGWWQALQEARPEEHLDLADDADLLLAYDFVMFHGLATAEHSSLLFSKVVQRIRQDECSARAQWEEYGGKRFTLEEARINAAAPIGHGDEIGHRLIQVDIPAANVDGRVFKDPFKFDPGRDDYHQALTFNGLESEMPEFMSDFYWPPSNNTSSLHRVCPGRWFVLGFVSEVAPLFFPELAATCERGNRVRDGVVLHTDLIDSRSFEDRGDRPIRVEVLTTPNPSELARADRLIVLLPDVLFPSVVFQPLIKEMDSLLSGANVFWAMNLPGSGQGTRLSTCNITVTAHYVENILRDVKAKQPGIDIYLVGNGFGGVVGWYVTQALDSDQVLTGFMTLGGPHPLAYMATHGSSHHTEYYGTSFVDPMVSQLYTKKTLDSMEGMIEEQFDAYLVRQGVNSEEDRDYLMASKFHPWMEDHKRFWGQTGADRLTCHYADSIAFDSSGHPMWIDSLAASLISPEKIHILLTAAILDPVRPAEAMIRSGVILTSTPGRIIDFHSFDSSFTQLNFIDPEAVQDVAGVLAKFISRCSTLRLSVWQFWYEDNLQFLTTRSDLGADMLYCWCAAVAICFSSLLVEMFFVKFVLPALLGYRYDAVWWYFSSVFVVGTSVLYYSLSSAGTIVLASMGVCFFGAPVVVVFLSAPFQSRRVSSAWISFILGGAVLCHRFGSLLVVASVAQLRSSANLFTLSSIPICFNFDMFVVMTLNRFQPSVVLRLAALAFMMLLDIGAITEMLYLRNALTDSVAVTGVILSASCRLVYGCIAAFYSASFMIYSEDACIVTV